MVVLPEPDGPVRQTKGFFGCRREHGCRRRADLIVKYLLTAEDELCLIAHGEDNILHIDDTHDLTS